MIEIIPETHFVGPDDFKHGWEPTPLVNEHGIRNDLNAITPKEMALFLAFCESSNFSFQGDVHFYNVGTTFQDRLDIWRSMGVTADYMHAGMSMHHETDYMCAIALWHDRDTPIDFKGSYPGYASAYDATQYSQGRVLSLNTHVPMRLGRSLEKFERFAEAGYRMVEDVRLAAYSALYPEFVVKAYEANISYT